ncbi:MAG TPA: hypothetical protein VFJ16_25320 [Longimicrobium sp.]|nr:hypothetical protein [Longimicrobium sp.]
MIARAVPAANPAPPSTPAMVGNKRPQPHRFHLTSGRVLEGNLHRAPNARLADHLTTLKGYISVTDALCTQSGERFPYIVLNADHVVFIEELPAGARGPQVAAAPAG